jgi:hypothetical protein
MFTPSPDIVTTRASAQALENRGFVFREHSATEAAATALSSASVIANTLRLRAVKVY